MIKPKGGFSSILAVALTIVGQPSGRIPHLARAATLQIPRDSAVQKPGTGVIRGRVVASEAAGVLFRFGVPASLSASDRRRARPLRMTTDNLSSRGWQAADTR